LLKKKEEKEAIYISLSTLFYFSLSLFVLFAKSCIMK